MVPIQFKYCEQLMNKLKPSLEYETKEIMKYLPTNERYILATIHSIGTKKVECIEK